MVGLNTDDRLMNSGGWGVGEGDSGKGSIKRIKAFCMKNLYEKG